MAFKDFNVKDYEKLDKFIPSGYDIYSIGV